MVAYLVDGKRMKRGLTFAGLVCVASLVGTSCGGRSQNERGEPTPSAGGEANIAGGPSAAGSDAAGAPSAICPNEQPTPGEYCNYQSSTNYCSYEIDKCSSVSFECFQHVWLTVPQLDGAAYDCNFFQPPNAPKDGDSCECMGSLDCTYDDCDERGRIHAVCDNTSWHVKESRCSSQGCGPDGLSCQAGEVCVIHTGLAGPAFECVHNLCEATSVSCACAAVMCKSFEVCSMDSGTVVCTCLTC